MVPGLTLGDFTDCFEGKMSMTIPPFVNLEHDTALRKAYVTVEDREVKKQREMCGEKSSSIRFYLILTV